ncbi:MAG: hypothetical protein ACREMK_07740 [Gemmatimonadota bacterium]
MVTLLDSTDSAVSEGITNSQGIVNLSVPRQGMWRLVAERIGYYTVKSVPFHMSVETSREIALTAPVDPIEIESLTVEIDADCRPDLSPTRPAGVLWEEARKTLERVRWTHRNNEHEFQLRLYTRLLGVDLKFKREEVENITVSGFSPFATIPPELLNLSGFIHTEEQDTIYFGPDAELLLSDAFAQTHCFYSLADTTGQRVGLAFEPIASQTSDIAGVLWLDAESAALREIIFHYTGPIAETVDLRHEGKVSLQRIQGGGWIVSKWWIRLPLFSRPLVLKGSLPYIHGRRQLINSGYIERGGEVREIRRIERTH